MKKSRLSRYLRQRFAQASSRALSLKRQAPLPPQASEFEVLENRLLLSGVTSGIDQTRVQYTDADGDLVTVAVRGVGATFDIELAGGLENGADAVSITLKGAGASLGISVAPQGFETDDITPGFTTVGLITTKETSIGSINLNAVIVPVIDLGNADVVGIKLTTGQVAKVDSLMSANEFSIPGFEWAPGLDGLDVFDVTAGSIDQINLAGSRYAGNDFLGTIKITEGGLENLTGTNSGFYGHLVFEGKASSLGHVVLGNGWSNDATISAAGDLTLQAEDFAALVTVGGHLNVSFTNGFFGTIFADGGVSGLRADTTDAITVTDGSFRGQLISGGEVADIMFSNSRLDGGVIEATNIGTVRFDGNSGWQAGTILSSGDIGGVVIRGGLDVGAGSLLLSAEGNLGHLSIANGNLNGAVAAGSIGDIMVNGGDLNATLVAKTGDIGNIAVDFGRIGGTIVSQAGNIGDITVLSDTYGAAISGKIIAGSGSIGTIDVTNLGWGEAIGNGGTIFAMGDIAAINASTTGDIAIGSATITAQGSLGPVTAIAYGAGGGGAIDGLTLVAPTISAVTGTSISGIGIANSTFIATTGAVANISGTGKTGGLNNVTVNAATSIGNIFGNATVSGDGIFDSVFVAQNGTIGSVTGKTSGAGGFDGIDRTNISASGDIVAVTGTAFGGYGIFDSNITSLAGNIGAVSGSSSEVGARNGHGIYIANITALAGKITSITGTAAGFGDGIYAVTAQALTGIGTIKGTSVFGAGINQSDFTVSGPGANIDAVIGQTSEGVAIRYSNFTAIGGTIGTLSATPTGIGGAAIGGSNFTAATLGALTVNVTNLAGGYAINSSEFTATQGDIGAITVNNDSLSNAASGITNSAFTSNKGNIGSLTVTTDGNFSTGVEFSRFTAAGTIGAIGVTTTGNNSSGITNNSVFTADSDNSGAGDITSITVKVDGVGSNGIAGFSTITGQNIGSVDVHSTSLGGGYAMNYSKLNAMNIGNVSVTGTFNGALLAGVNIGNIAVAGDASGLVQVGTAAYGNIGDVTVRTVNGLSLFAGSANHSGNIGNIAITGTDEIDGQQFLSVAANMVGRISAGANKGDGDSLTLNLGVNTVSVGAIIVANADSGEKAHLALAGGETLLALNNISVDGNLTFVSSIESLRIIGTISANSILSSGVTIGSGGAGTSIGLISLATGSADATTFQFLTMNGVTAPGSATLAVSFADATADITTAQASTNNGVTNVSGGVRMNMI
jgi:hypothetical protein